jgi:ABC-type nitrate/sulfonate/bicarbonate transport system substrate-binding protein
MIRGKNCLSILSRPTTWLLVVILLLAAGVASAETFRMGILPVIDTLPLQVGVMEGYFKAENIDLKLVSFSSAMEPRPCKPVNWMDFSAICRQPYSWSKIRSRSGF